LYCMDHQEKRKEVDPYGVSPLPNGYSQKSTTKKGEGGKKKRGEEIDVVQ